ncbi:MAG: hypothetical protein U1F76_21940 [Candidatus Competibacteraceae bacterium]
MRYPPPWDGIVQGSRLITAVIVPKRSVDIAGAEILAHCRRELAPFKVPKKIIFVDALPKTPTGKILKRQLRLTLEPESDPLNPTAVIRMRSCAKSGRG